MEGMGLIHIPYRLVDGEPFPSPTFDVFLLGRQRRIRVPALMDSGAVRPIFQLGDAENAGIDLSKSIKHPIQYGGSVTPGWITRARIEIKADLIMHAVDTSIVFVETLDLRYRLLGRVGFFDRFDRVSFLQKCSPSYVELHG